MNDIMVGVNVHNRLREKRGLEIIKYIQINIMLKK